MASFLSSTLAICAGACAGSLLRWLANSLLNVLPAPFPLGTLAANWTGALFMGIALGFFGFFPNLAPQWKLAAITGFLGSLTTFSAFAAEMASLIQNGRLLACAAAISLHVAGSIALVFAGLALFRLGARLFSI